ncbi:LysR family transcriptional regulator [Bacillus sp. SL00103]
MMFQTASKVLNFTKTAQMLGYAQSSITANIVALEEELGTPLFERLGKRVILTESGRQFQHYTDKILGLTGGSIRGC